MAEMREAMMRGAAVTLAVVGGLMLVASATLLLAGGQQAAYISGDFTLDLIGLASYLPWLGAGLFLVLKLPRHPIGWILLVSGVGLTLQNLGGRGVVFTHDVESSPIRLTEILALVGDAAWIPSLAIGLIALLLLYPNGRLLSPRWRWVLWLSGIAAATYLAGTLLIRAPLYFMPSVSNPLGVFGDPRLFETIQDIPIFVLLVVALPLGTIAAVIRWRRSEQLERHQIKWLLWAVLIQVLAIVTAILGERLIRDAPVAGGWTGAVNDIASLAFPVAIAVAILRYRLYEIDRIVSRTVSYTLIAMVLAGVYAGGVIGIQTLLPVSDDLAVAASTLAAVVGFAPLRRRVQDGVDRRFNRRRYDAEQIVDAFATKLRDAVDLDAVTTDLEKVVSKTLEPDATAIWLR